MLGSKGMVMFLTFTPKMICLVPNCIFTKLNESTVCISARQLMGFYITMTAV